MIKFTRNVRMLCGSIRLSFHLLLDLLPRPKTEVCAIGLYHNWWSCSVFTNVETVFCICKFD